MSYHTLITYGYGVRTDNIKVKSLEKLKMLISLGPQAKAYIEDWLKENGYKKPTLKNYLEYDEEGRYHLAAILKMVIYEQEGVYLTACKDLKSKEYLVLEPKYPWELKGKDKKITKEKLEDIFHKYFSMITDDVIEVEKQVALNRIAI